MSVIRLEAKPVSLLQRHDRVLPEGWRVEHMVKTDEHVTAVGHTHTGRTFCINMPLGLVVRTYREEGSE